ncbi:GTP-binding protein, identical [Reticulomyxa filosa]|uniref:GTP-binding protein, identical n=1 Tax=Reticulomyxa filosa TaxID=46433 RepID=X6L7E6_RETFI|nr:GTP-binding protein, identical [Reticulomyxa filosa]|eukprot:ETN97255.1 GTP-binding protein, identical [Reticulomyxa filosa]
MYIKGVPFVICGTKNDLREWECNYPFKNEEHRCHVQSLIIKNWFEKNVNGKKKDKTKYKILPYDLISEILKFSSIPQLNKCINATEAEQFALKIGAFRYVECSSLKGQNLDNVIDVCLLAAASGKGHEKTKKCYLL